MRPGLPQSCCHLQGGSVRGPVTSMQALSSEYAGAYGGYGRQSALGGYGQKVQVVQPPPPGLAVQSLYQSQVSRPPGRTD